MTRDFATDQEIAADLIARARSERDPNLTREPINPFGPPAIVEHWPCRGGCGQMIGVPREGIDAFVAMNRELRRRRDPEVPKHKVMWCPKCKKRDDELARAQAEARATARRPREQLGMQLDAPSSEARALAARSAPQPRRRNKL